MDHSRCCQQGPDTAELRRMLKALLSCARCLQYWTHWTAVEKKLHK